MSRYIKMYEKLPNLVLGFHGCDKSTYDRGMILSEGYLLKERKHIPELSFAVKLTFNCV